MGVPARCAIPATGKGGKETRPARKLSCQFGGRVPVETSANRNVSFCLVCDDPRGNCWIRRSCGLSRIPATCLNCHPQCGDADHSPWRPTTVATRRGVHWGSCRSRAGDCRLCRESGARIGHLCAGACLLVPPISKVPSLSAISPPLGLPAVEGGRRTGSYGEVLAKAFLPAR